MGKDAIAACGPPRHKAAIHRYPSGKPYVWIVRIHRSSQRGKIYGPP
jgi:hypothetical protein